MTGPVTNQKRRICRVFEWPVHSPWPDIAGYLASGYCACIVAVVADVVAYSLKSLGEDFPEQFFAKQHYIHYSDYNVGFSLRMG